jgi:hypothetical protein
MDDTNNVMNNSEELNNVSSEENTSSEDNTVTNEETVENNPPIDGNNMAGLGGLLGGLLGAGGGSLDSDNNGYKKLFTEQIEVFSRFEKDISDLKDENTRLKLSIEFTKKYILYLTKGMIISDAILLLIIIAIIILK